MHFPSTICSLLLAAAVAMPLRAGATEPAGGEASCTGLLPGGVRTVARVIDGETVGLDDGSELRLIGALAPRAIDAGAEPGQWPMELAATEALRALLLGASIELAVGGEARDRYGRWQAQAYRLGGGARLWVQGHMLEQGLARAVTLAGNRACAEALLAAEAAARGALRGLWAEAAYRPRPAELARELLRYRSTFQLAEGRVARVAVVRGTIYLNFARDWRSGFSASLRGGDAAMLGTHARDPRGLEGAMVRVRGWIEQRQGAQGPLIDLSAAGDLEVLDAGPPPAAEPAAKAPGLVETGRQQ